MLHGRYSARRHFQPLPRRCHFRLLAEILGPLSCSGPFIDTSQVNDTMDGPLIHIAINHTPPQGRPLVHELPRILELEAHTSLLQPPRSTLPIVSASPGS